MKIGIIGLGRVGSFFFREVSDAGLRVHCFLDSDPSVIRNLRRQFPDSISSIPDESGIRECDFVIIAVQDRNIRSCSSELAEKQLLKRNAVVAHCSGSQSLAALDAVQKAHALRAIMHPLISIPDQMNVRFPNCLFGVTADEPALPRVMDFIRSLGGSPVEIPDSQRKKYHIASVMASNYISLLVHIASTMFMDLDIPAADAHAMACQLALSAVRGLSSAPFRSALSGPLARKDFRIVEEHLQAIDSDSEVIQKVYKALLTALLHYLTENDVLTADESCKLRERLKQGIQ